MAGLLPEPETPSPAIIMERLAPSLHAPSPTLVRMGALHTVVVRARELVGTALVGETQYTEAELDCFAALVEALDAVPQPGEA